MACTSEHLLVVAREIEGGRGVKKLMAVFGMMPSFTLRRSFYHILLEPHS